MVNTGKSTFRIRRYGQEGKLLLFIGKRRSGFEVIDECMLVLNRVLLRWNEPGLMVMCFSHIQGVSLSGNSSVTPKQLGKKFVFIIIGT